MNTLLGSKKLADLFLKKDKTKKIAEENYKETKWIVKNLGIKCGGVYLLHAYSNVGKSYAAVNLGLCIANEIPFLGCIPIQNSGKTCYLNYEMNKEAMMNYYFSRIAGGLEFEDQADLNCDLFTFPEIRIDDPEAEEVLTNLIKIEDYRVIFIDCLGASISNTDLNSDDARKAIDTLNRVANNTDCAIIVLHHEAKAVSNQTSTIRAAKGNNSIMNAVDGSIRLTKDDSTQIVTIELGKVRYFAHTAKEKLQYVLKDSNGKSLKLGTSAGIKLERVSSDKEISIKKENEEIISLLKILRDNKNVNQKTLIDLLKGLNINKNKTLQLIDQCIEDELISSQKAAKNSSYYFLLISGMTRLEEYEVACLVEEKESKQTLNEIDNIFSQ